MRLWALRGRLDVTSLTRKYKKDCCLNAPVEYRHWYHSNMTSLRLANIYRWNRGNIDSGTLLYITSREAQRCQCGRLIIHRRFRFVRIPETVWYSVIWWRIRWSAKYTTSRLLPGWFHRSCFFYAFQETVHVCGSERWSCGFVNGYLGVIGLREEAFDISPNMSFR